MDDGENRPADRVDRVINGEDNRQEYFNIENDRYKSAMRQHAVVFIDADTVHRLLSGDISRIPTWGTMNQLCADVAFADQPSAAVCSGVLVDWDLILTSGHCLDFFSTKNIKCLFGYYYSKNGNLEIRETDVYDIEKIVATSSTLEFESGIDYAWLQLDRRVDFPRQPSPIYTHWPVLNENDTVLAISGGGGMPMKLDNGGRIQDPRKIERDYFVASTDTFKGASGGGAWDSELGLIGILSRGTVDYHRVDGGCNDVVVSDNANEQFTYAHRAVAGLCEVWPERPICNPDCEQPCNVHLENMGDERAYSGCAFAYGSTVLNGIWKLLSISLP
jgi:hypothetical protein